MGLSHEILFIAVGFFVKRTYLIHYCNSLPKTVSNMKQNSNSRCRQILFLSCIVITCQKSIFSFSNLTGFKA
jgi:hypothetical protein